MALDEASRLIFQMRVALNRTMKTFVQNSLRELIDVTPVLTGWAQSNWLASVGPIPNEPVGSKDNLDHGPQQESLRVIRKYDIGQGPITIFNNVPYIGDLNSGTSRKAPAGFVDEVFDKIAKEVEGLSLR